MSYLKRIRINERAVFEVNEKEGVEYPFRIMVQQDREFVYLELTTDEAFELKTMIDNEFSMMKGYTK